MAEKTNTPGKRPDVSIKLPIVKGEADKYVALNGKAWLVKRGEYVTLPAEVADILIEAEEQHERSVKFAIEKEQEFIAAMANPTKR